jgi:hypothetical protein
MITGGFPHFQDTLGSTGIGVVTPMKRDYVRRSGHVSRFTHHLVVNHLKSKRAVMLQNWLTAQMTRYYPTQPSSDSLFLSRGHFQRKGYIVNPTNQPAGHILEQPNLTHLNIR